MRFSVLRPEPSSRKASRLPVRSAHRRSSVGLAALSLCVAASLAIGATATAGDPVAGSGTPPLEGKTSIVGGETSVLEGETSVLEGETSVLEGETSVLDGGTSVLEGEWYVLSHFREDVSPEDAGVQDYRDAVWRFERSGDRLRWTLYPDFGFRDESARFEDVRGERARIPHAWRPTAGQMAEIRAGLTLVDRSARTRSLRRVGAEGWQTGGGARLGNASSVAYGEEWGIETGDGRLAFVRAATLRSGRAGSMQGVTRFDVEVLDPDGGYMEGRYARDGREHGRFFMWRKGASSERDAVFVAVSNERSFFGPGGAARMPVADLEQRIATHDDSQTERTAIRAGIRRLVEESYTRRGLAVHPHDGEIEALTSEIERLAVIEGVPLAEIERRYVAGELAP